jgi:hypothetical protein
MSKRLRPLAALACLVLALTALSACGSGKSTTTTAADPPKTIPANSVALVGSTPITKANLTHWMHSMLGGDYWERFGKRAPVGLVSEPANYAACEAAARGLVAQSGHELTPAQISQRCRQLHVAIREQALLFLINVLWRVNEGKENGITVSDAATTSYSAKYIAKFYPKPGEYEKYLATHEWAPSDELYQVKRNLLTTALKEKVTGRSRKLEETPQSRAKYFSFVEQHIPKRKSETRCVAAYAVSMCTGYTEPASSPPAPDEILEELVQ